ncbi:MAG: 3'(2'),5'-bisphosphate nucleotidase CysQ [Chromatiaceae bacterium]|nr:3'(2'),5'-bisphosphate nucleotidase CysQ [Gammaproteobacteria bacterium]MCP5305338.1 3'(2'),5'-bisphosphate nucleotidase CysQ [Chromatiaceae bacterium]MCP5315297.1 3'(2'),5'-bisphosphate nucleotidase CysQ [Chromatiaceae bacterium]
MDQQAQQLLDIARSAGQAILKVYHQDFAVEEKDDKSPLTAADLASHRTIVRRLAEMEPDTPVLSEEGADIPFATRSSWTRYWLIDPLDGTREFVKRNGEFTVNIALIEDGRPTVGVVHVPVTGISYLGQVGQGAWKIDGDGVTRSIRVTENRQTPLRVAGSRSHAGDSLLRFLQRVGEHEIVSMGSSLKLCLVAEGTADIYPRLGPTSEWDTAAAQAVVEAAGGLVTDTQLQPLRYNTKESLLNPHFLVFGDRSEDWGRYL